MATAEQLAKEAESSFKNIDEDVEGMAKGAENFQKAGDIAFVKYVIEFYHERQELLKTMARIRTEANALTRIEKKSDEKFYKTFERPNFSLVDVAENQLHTFWRFLEVFNIHVAYVQDYAGFHTLQGFIRKRISMFEALKRAVKAPSYARFMKEDQVKAIDSELTDLQNRYATLGNTLKPLNDLFGEFHKRLNVIYDYTIQLETFKPFTTVKKPGLFGMLLGHKPSVEFRRDEVVAYFKKNNPLLTSKDKARLVDIRKLTDRLHGTVVVAIRNRKAIVRQEIMEISEKEGELSNLLQKVSKTVNESIQRQREQLMPEKKAA